jgi:hypothetical protein
MNAIVYHIFCVGDYINVVKNQIKRVIDSGLYEWCDRFEVTCIDPEGVYQGIDEIFVSLDKVNIFKTTENRYEYLSIKKVWDISQINDGKLFYFHTKGVSNKYKNLITKETSEWKSKGVETWKECLEFFLIDKFRDCLEKLDEYDTCGVTCNNGWYSGNFWWTNMSYIRTNSEPGMGDRWYFENWLNSGKKYNGFEFYHFDYNGYFSYLPHYVFKDGKKLNDFDCKLIDAQYGAIDIQQDEGYGVIKTSTLIDVTKTIKSLIQEGKTVSVVDNIYFTDPAYMQKKYLIINFKINEDECRIVFNEGWKYDINFLKMEKKKPKILFLGHTSKIYDGHSIKIDRSDLTRKMSCLETWVPEVEYEGHEVIFFEGNADELKYDFNNRLLSLPIPGDYDYNPSRVEPPRSLMLERLVGAIEWSLMNKEFDYIFRTDDGSYINYFILDKVYDEIDGFDSISNGFGGGGGMFFSRDLCEKIVKQNNENKLSLMHHIEDVAIHRVIPSLTTKIKYLNIFSHQYVVGEDLFTIHYTNGKRMYFTDSILKRYYYEDKMSKRNIILNYPIHNTLDPIHEYPNTWNHEGRLTPIWYSYTTNHINWEHYGQLMRSNFECRLMNPFGKNSTMKLVFYKTIFDVDKSHEKDTLLSYFKSIRDEGEIMFFLENETDTSNKMIEFLSNSNLKIQKGINDIKHIIDSTEIKSESGLLIKITKYES